MPLSKNDLSDALDIYREAMRAFLARTLLAQNNQLKSWFDDLVLAKLQEPVLGELKRRRANFHKERRRKQPRNKRGDEYALDVPDFETVISVNWQPLTAAGVFDDRKIFNWMSEVTGYRNQWAHDSEIPEQDVQYALETCAKVLDACEPDAATQVRALFDRARQPLQPTQDVADPKPDSTSEPSPEPPAAAYPPTGGLKPWRDVIQPHEDVRKGTYAKAEFAADLQQVYLRRGSREYRDPVEFYRRTYMTPGTHSLLTRVVSRLRGEGGDPVIDLRTAFGGGKTHTLLAVLHLVRDAAKLAANADIQLVYRDAGGEPPAAKIAVFVGTNLSPVAYLRNEEQTGGFNIHTIWGEIAWQLAGHDGYDIIAEHDRTGVAPGAADLDRLFELAGPSVILIDELVAYLRNVRAMPNDAAGGDFGAHQTFCQALTESARRSPHTVVLVSIPESEMEYGDHTGQQTADIVNNIFQRVDALWEPVSAAEGFEVVRRRLFGDFIDEAERDRTCEAFIELYRQGSDFPSECREPDYLKRLKGSYPIHPEIFTRLYEDWSSNIDRFQRTRGVLRLMADTIHRLWDQDDRAPLIMPGSIPLAGPGARQQLVDYLGDQWNATVDADIDGEDSVARKVEKENVRFDRIQACRRLSRTIFLGSVPGNEHRGVEDTRIKLGTVQPCVDEPAKGRKINEEVAVYGDALRTLAGRLSFLYNTDQKRYWFDVRPNLNKVASDRISQVTEDDAWEELRRRLRESPAFRERSDFASIHVAPAEPAEVPDRSLARLVILDPQHTHSLNKLQSTAQKQAALLLGSSGPSPRTHSNMLVFLALDEAGKDALTQAAQRFLGWRSIKSDIDQGLRLDATQQRQARDSLTEADRSVAVRLNEHYKWVIDPEQDGTKPIVYTPRILNVSAVDLDASPTTQASARLREAGTLIMKWSPYMLNLELDKWLWKDGVDHLGVKYVWEDLLTKYVYFPRLRDQSVLEEAVREGVLSKYFGYADGPPNDEGRYPGLRFGTPASVVVNDSSVLVRKDIAEAQEEPKTPQTPDDPPAPKIGDDPEKPAAPRRFYATAKLSSARLGRDASQIADEVVKHLEGLDRADVEITIDIQAVIPDGVPDDVIRTITENANTLKFENHGFEAD